jgi:signal peptidase II
VSRPASPARGRAWLLAGAVALVTIVCDQVAKAAVRSSLELGERVDLIFGIDLTRVTNSGIAFGLFDDGGALVPVITAAALLAVIVWFALAPDRPGLWLAVGLLTGGALGNLVDRVRDSAVTDFLDPPLWPAFNVADIAVTLGALTLALVALRIPAGDDDEEPGGPP